MKINITLIEDHITDSMKLTSLINKWASERNCTIDIKNFTSGEEYLRLGTKNMNITHLFILDIQMKNISGLEIAKILRNNNFQGEIIFLSAFREYVFNGYNVHALNYLLKPVNSAILYHCLDEISNKLTSSNYIYRSGKNISNIPYNEIICFSSRLHYIEILTTTDLLIQNSSLNSINKFLPAEFIRTHRSYIVNISHISRISGKTITLTNNKTISIGRTYMKAVLEQFIHYSCRFES